MKEFKRCIPCGGSGKILGGGMIQKNCEECNGIGKMEVIDDDIEFLAMKQTETYKEAKAKLKEDCNIKSDEEAEKMLDNAITKEKDKTRKKKGEISHDIGKTNTL